MTLGGNRRLFCVACMSNDTAVRNKIRDTLRERFASLNLDLFTAYGPQSVNYADPSLNIAENCADIFFRFWKVNGRMPTVLFNDGVPPSWKSALERDPGYQAVFGFYLWKDVYQLGGEAHHGVDLLDVRSLMLFNCKLMPRPGLTAEYQYINRINADHETTETVIVPVDGPVNARTLQYGAIPRHEFTEGAFQTWGTLLVVATHPHLVYATDEGLMLTMDGVGIIERSAAHWLSIALREFGLPGDDVIAAHLGEGPSMLGIPLALVDGVRKQMEAAKRAGYPLAMIAKWVMSFVGFYFGAAAASGLVGGAFTIPNLSGTLNLVSKFGVDTGNVATPLKIVGALTGDMNLSDTLSTGGTMDEWDFWSEIGINPESISGFDPSVSTSFDSMDFGAMTDAGAFIPDDMGGYDLWADIGIDPTTIIPFHDMTPDSWWDASGDALSTVSAGDYGPPPSIYDEVEIQASNNAAMAEALKGPVSPTQYAAAVSKASPAAGAAVQAAMKKAGASPTSTNVSPATAQRAAQIAQQQAAITGDGIWGTASRILQLYGQYQQIQAQQGKALPYGGLKYPSAGQQGNIVRQPDGSISIRNADGSISTVRPNGQTITTQPGQSLPEFLAKNKTLLIAAGVGIVAVVGILAMRERR